MGVEAAVSEAGVLLDDVTALKEHHTALLIDATKCAFPT
jgi:hypothetical protein